MSLEELLGRRRNAKTLRALRIDEVSSVNAGAGRGVRVVMLKRDAQENETMSQPLTPFLKADIGCKEYANDPGMLMKLLERIAAEEGLSLTEAHATSWGRMLLQKSVTGHRDTVILKDAHGDAADVIKNQMSGEEGTAPGSRQHNRDNRARHHHVQGDDLNPDAEEASAQSANKLACERFRALAESYSKVHSVSLDRAYTVIASSELGKTLLKQDAAQHGVYR